MPSLPQEAAVQDVACATSQLCICLDHLKEYLCYPALFRAKTPGSDSSTAIQHMASNLAAPHQVANLLVLWLAASPRLLLPLDLQLQILTAVNGALPPVHQLHVIHHLVKEADQKSTSAVKLLLLFLQEYLQKQRHYTLERTHVAEVFAPLLFGVALERRLSTHKEAERATALVICQATAILSTMVAAPCTAMPPLAEAAMPSLGMLARAGRQDPALNQAPLAAEDFEDAWRSDPDLHSALDWLVPYTVTSALFASEDEEEMDEPMEEPATLSNPPQRLRAVMSCPTPAKRSADVAMADAMCTITAVTAGSSGDRGGPRSRMKQHGPSPLGIAPSPFASSHAAMAAGLLLPDSFLAELLLPQARLTAADQGAQLRQRYTYPHRSPASGGFPQLQGSGHSSVILV